MARSRSRSALCRELWGLPVALIGGWPEPVVAWCELAALGLGNAVADIYGFSLFNLSTRGLTVTSQTPVTDTA